MTSNTDLTVVFGSTRRLIAAQAGTDAQAEAMSLRMSNSILRGVNAGMDDRR